MAGKSSNTGLWSLLGAFLGSCLGIVIIFGIVISVIVGGIAGAIEDMVSSEEEQVDGGQVLVINLNKPIVEKAEMSPFDDLDLPIQISESKYGLNQIRKVLQKATTDEKVKAILLKVENPMCGYAKLAEIKEELEAFRENSSKQVIAYGESMTEKAYYLATSADKIYITPAGLLEFRGLRTELLFFKGLFDKLELEPVVFRVGKYKSAVEPFLLDRMSDENRTQVREFLDEILTENLKEIGEDRALIPSKLREINDNLTVRNINTAVNLNLIDGAKYYDEVISSLYSNLGIEEGTKTLSFLSYGESDMEEFMETDLNDTKSKIAVVIAEGEIVSGKGYKDERIGSTSFNKDLREAVSDSTVKAIVIRINSPGGSALASDVMWREIKNASAVKPVVCSMSDVAASGGYYMAMACDYIYAQPNTITGSIGVFGLSVELDDFLKKKLGITTDRVKTGEYSDLGSPLKKMTDEEFEIIQKEVERIYEVFTTKAAEGRNMTVDQLKELASGRVWSGVRAQKIGLVDELGGMNSAVKKAVELSNTTDYELEYYPNSSDFFSQLKGEFETKYETQFLEEKLGGGKELIDALEYINSLDVVQARLPMDIKID